MANQAPAHWSKDYVEHLRTVHFALIAISAGLILLVFSSKQYNAVTALVQMEEILDLKKQWSIDWITRPEHSFADYVVPRRELENLFAGFGSPALSYVSLMSKRGMGTVLIEVKDPEKLLIKAKIPRENYYHQRLAASDWSPSQFPRSLNEFESWWDGLGVTPPIYVPDSILDPAIIGADHSKSVVAGSEQLMDRVIEAFNSTVVTTDLTLTELEPSPQTHWQPPHGLIYASTFVQKSQSANRTDILSRSVWIDIGRFKRYYLTQNGVSASYRNLRPGPFKQSFRNLSIAVGAEAGLPLETVREFLHDEAAKGPEVFEAFGMKFPAGQITFWGVVLVLSVQLYFLVYLRQLFERLKQDDPGWDVPWIGMGSSRLSSIILYVSLVLLPCVAAFLIGWQATIRLSSGYWNKLDEHWYHPVQFLAWPWHWHYTVLLKILFLIVTVIVSGYLGLQSWKYRPQIAPEQPKPPSCPAQLFE